LAFISFGKLKKTEHSSLANQLAYMKQGTVYDIFESSDAAIVKSLNYYMDIATYRMGQ